MLLQRLNPTLSKRVRYREAIYITIFIPEILVSGLLMSRLRQFILMVQMLIALQSYIKINILCTSTGKVQLIRPDLRVIYTRRGSPKARWWRRSRWRGLVNSSIDWTGEIFFIVFVIYRHNTIFRALSTGFGEGSRQEARVNDKKVSRNLPSSLS